MLVRKYYMKHGLVRVSVHDDAIEWCSETPQEILR